MKGHVVGLFWMLSSLGLPGTLLSAPPNDLGQYREVRYVMGTLLDITLCDQNPQKARKALDEAFSLAEKLDDLLSNYKAQSEVTRLNQKAGEGKVKVSADLCDFLGLTKVLSEKTQGAFDITVGPLVDLWKDAYKRQALPSSDSVKAAKLLVGANRIVLHSNCDVEMTPKGVKIDTGGIGKGHAVDKIVELLRTEKITSALINFGQSSIYALGAPPQAAGWRLVLQFPDQTPLGILELKDQALSASDSLGSHFAIAGKIYGHIMDPKTGIPISARIQTVVLSPSATEAEVLSKSVILRGWANDTYAKGWKTTEILRADETGKISRSEHFPMK